MIGLHRPIESALHDKAIPMRSFSVPQLTSRPLPRWLHMLALPVFLALPASAYAYIDPGTGSILIQGLIAGLAFIAAFWRRIRNFFSSWRRKSDSSSGDAG